MRKALRKLPYHLGKADKIRLTDGDILQIDRQGNQLRSTFDTDLLYSCCGYYPHQAYASSPILEDDYLEYIHQLKTCALFYGYTEDMVDSLLEDGYLADYIEDMLYCGAI